MDAEERQDRPGPAADQDVATAGLQRLIGRHLFTSRGLRLRFFGEKRPPSAPRAFEELVSAHLDALYRTSLRLCTGERAEAEDLFQNAMLRAFEHFAELQEPESARAWLFTILVRTNLNRLRARRRRAETLVSDLDEQAFEDALAAWRRVPSIDELFDQALTREHIAAALDALDEPLRVIVWLGDVEGFRQR